MCMNVITEELVCSRPIISVAVIDTIARKNNKFMGRYERVHVRAANMLVRYNTKISIRNKLTALSILRNHMSGQTDFRGMCVV